jgi:hypothetical protein
MGKYLMFECSNYQRVNEMSLLNGDNIYLTLIFLAEHKKANSTSIELAFYKNELLNKAILL